LNRAGAVLIGKAAMIELAGGLGYSAGNASLTGPARNPWNTAYWTCGSSSGSGAVVAAGLAAWALGSDTRGSIICPSAWCGVSGMRPSFGRVSRFGSMDAGQARPDVPQRRRLRFGPLGDCRTRS
jgi:aspartyl-tRNA(Asn)/glutamyl-tRNA(Gln) amidotransferase subunit A